jgi:integrase
MRGVRKGLERQGLKFRYKRRVPEKLRPYLGGRSWLLVPLNVSDLREALKLQPRAAADCEEQLQRAQAMLDGRLSAHEAKLQELEREALGWRDELAGRHNVDSVLDMAATDRAEQIEAEHGEAAAQFFATTVFGKSISLDLALSSYLAEHRTSASNQRSKAYAVELLKRGTRTTHVDQINRRVAGQFVSWLATEAPQERGTRGGTRAPATVNQIVTRLGALWDYLVRRGHVEVNPWSKQLVKAPPRSTKRALTGAELAALFTGALGTGGRDDEVRDALLCLLLTGMRMSELLGLRMSDVVVKDGVTCLFVRKGKTDSSVRHVPCCQTVLGIVEELSSRAGAKDNDPLFTVKHSVVYRALRRVIHDKTVDAHSLRRSFITLAEQAGAAPHLIEAVVGHRRAGQSLGRYSAGPSMGQLLGVVEVTEGLALQVAAL